MPSGRIDRLRVILSNYELFPLLSYTSEIIDYLEKYII